MVFNDASSEILVVVIFLLPNADDVFIEEGAYVEAVDALPNEVGGELGVHTSDTEQNEPDEGELVQRQETSPNYSWMEVLYQVQELNG